MTGFKLKAVRCWVALGAGLSRGQKQPESPMMKTNTLRKLTLAAAFCICSLALPLMADDDCEPSTRPPSVPEPSTLLATAVAGVVGCGLLLKRRQQQ